MKIITLNVNGIRASAKKGLFDWLKKEDPDIDLFTRSEGTDRGYKGYYLLA